MIIKLKVGKPTIVDGFTNVRFKAFRSHNHEIYVFSIVDIPFMNPYD